MRFMVLVKATADSEAGKMPSLALLTAMGKFNEELVSAGVLLAVEISLETGPSVLFDAVVVPEGQRFAPACRPVCHSIPTGR